MEMDSDLEKRINEVKGLLVIRHDHNGFDKNNDL